LFKISCAAVLMLHLLSVLIEIGPACWQLCCMKDRMQSTFHKVEYISQYEIFCQSQAKAILNSLFFLFEGVRNAIIRNRFHNVK